MSSHNHSGIHAPGKSDSDTFGAGKITWETAGKHIPQFLIIGFRIEGSFLLPFLRFEIGSPPLNSRIPKVPGGCRRQDENIFEYRSVFQDAAASDKFPKSLE
jgi:hypothetical protein